MLAIVATDTNHFIIQIACNALFYCLSYAINAMHSTVLAGVCAWVKLFLCFLFLFSRDWRTLLYILLLLAFNSLVRSLYFARIFGFVFAFLYLLLRFRHGFFFLYFLSNSQERLSFYSAPPYHNTFSLFKPRKVFFLFLFCFNSVYNVKDQSYRYSQQSTLIAVIPMSNVYNAIPSWFHHSYWNSCCPWTKKNKIIIYECVQ